MYKYFLDIFPLFTIPFNVGLLFFICTMIYKTLRWTMEIEDSQWKILKGFLPQNIWASVKEICRESLLHLRIFKQNLLLGYMHTSLAFGWFLLIVFGNIEAKIVRGGLGTGFELPHYPIFLKYFATEGSHSLPKTVIDFSIRTGFFDFMMDLLLLIILSGCCLAYLKRFHSTTFGMKRTTKLRLGDKITMGALWCIFPARLIAESITSGAYGTGSFLTGTLGNVFAQIIPQAYLLKSVAPFWWIYSITLGIFFVGVPYSRYMHILSEPVLIFMRNAGVKPSKKNSDGFSQAEIFSCSRCGICVNNCQLARATEIRSMQPTYLNREIRHHVPLSQEMLRTCLMCGRCNVTCPVKIDSIQTRANERRAMWSKHNENCFAYLPKVLKESAENSVDVLYFAGCMTHLTPVIKNSMMKIMRAADENFQFLDENGTICCGRPLKLSGQEVEAEQLMAANKERIINSGAKLLVTSCPICYNTFKNEYNLPIEVVHHTEYIQRLIAEGKLQLTKTDEQVAYHDPCELARGTHVTVAPREVLNAIAVLDEQAKQKGEKTLCCGGSLGSTRATNEQRQNIAKAALRHINPDKHTLVTACPMCKRTFAQVSDTKVVDISELVAKNIKE